MNGEVNSDLVKPRYFNSIIIDKQRGLLTKFSENTDKFLDEISWYINMPNSLQYMLPRIYNYSLNTTKPYISMELYGYKTLHDIMINQNLTISDWNNIFKQIHFLIEEMMNFSYLDKTRIKNSLYEMYIIKTIKRLTKLKNNKTFERFFENDLYLNCEKLYSINTIINLLNTKVKELLVDSFDEFFYIIHGDLCFPNILIETKFNFLKIIDPRGSFGDFKLFGDRRYELAKILHSIDGSYDYIIEDLFDIELNGNNIKYELFNNSKFLKKIFKNEFNLSNEDYNIIKLIESLLFLSMIPLHNDNIERQLAMFATGNLLFFEVINGK